MASKQLTVDVAHVQSLGMVAPIEGLAVLAKLMCTYGSSEVWGAATPIYWKLLLRGVKERPRLFSILYERDSKSIQVNCKALSLVDYIAIVLTLLEVVQTSGKAFGKGIHMSGMQARASLQARDGTHAPKKTKIPEIRARIAQFVENIIGQEAVSSEPLVSQGLDSLAAMELRQKVQVRQQIERSIVSTIMKDSLGAHLMPEDGFILSSISFEQSIVCIVGAFWCRANVFNRQSCPGNN